jgi:hypothetical protein
MPVDAQGRWYPNLFPKQARLVSICKSGKKRFILASGPRLSGKSLGCLHAICDHAFYTDPANVALVTVTQSSGYDSGIWTDLTELVIPEWIEGDFGMDWVKRPAIQNISKKPYCVVTNSNDNPVRFQLESLKNEQEVESRFKSKRYSCMFINELSNFRHLKTLMTWKECLRMVGLPDEKHLLLADTNPADDGAKSWIYRLFFEIPAIDFDRDKHSFTDEQVKELKFLQPLLHALEFNVEENTFVTDARKAELRATYASDPDLYARYIHGKWVTSSVDALFLNVFRPSVHVIGEIESPGNPHPMAMVTEEKCWELYTGWDLGVVNSAACIVEKITAPNNPHPTFKVLDELVVVGEDFSMDDFVLAFVEKMRFWEQAAGKKLRWTHYSDRSAFDLRDPRFNLYHHQIVYQASPEDTPGGRIQLIAAARGRDSVQQRVDLMRKVLWEERIFFSNTLCPATIEMLKSIRRGRSQLHTIEKGNPHKHIFDAIMYCVASESSGEMSDIAFRMLRTKGTSNSVVSLSI